MRKPRGFVIAAIGLATLSAASSTAGGDEVRRVPIRTRSDGLRVWAHFSGTGRESVRPYLEVPARPDLEAALPATREPAPAEGISAKGNAPRGTRAAVGIATQALDAFSATVSGRASFVETATVLRRLKSAARRGGLPPSAAVAREERANAEPQEISPRAGSAARPRATDTGAPGDPIAPPETPFASGTNGEEDRTDRIESCESCCFRRTLN